MPLYDYECGACGDRFEELVTADQAPVCPSCGAAAPRRLFSQFSPPPKVGLRGAEARRADTLRRTRAEQRRERRAQRRDREARG